MVALLIESMIDQGVNYWRRDACKAAIALSSGLEVLFEFWAMQPHLCTEADLSKRCRQLKFTLHPDVTGADIPPNVAM
eukprot:2700791-Heterocapsa_arctica.AAC.1